MSLGDIVLTAGISLFVGFVFGHLSILKRIRKKGFQDDTHTYSATERLDNIK